MSGRAGGREDLRRWIIERSGRVGPDELRDDTPLLARRILTSLHVLDLLLYVERLSGRPVDVERLQPGAFRDIDSICRAFLDPR
jgi:hypothetical protein